MFYDYFTMFCSEALAKNKKKNKFLNSLVWRNTFINLMNVASYAFKWEGLPDTCNERFLELALLTRGVACIANDPELGFLSLFASPDDGLNIYGEFGKIFATGMNGYNKAYLTYVEGLDNSMANAVICRDNNMMIPYVNYIIRATDRLMSAERSLDVASKKLKNPYFITCDQTQEASVKKILNDIDDNADSVIGSKTVMPDMFKVFPTNVDTSTLKVLWEHYNNVDNQIRTLLGVNNNNATGKRERLLTDEINANNEVTDINIDMRLEQRKKFCEQVNELFGLNISVDLRSAFKEENDEVQEIQPDGLEQPVE